MPKNQTVDSAYTGVHPDWLAFLTAHDKLVSLPYESPQAPFWPRQQDRFNAFKHTGIKETKVLILGQDPYHGAGQATGLAFAVPESVPLPPSLRNIFKERQSDLGTTGTPNSDLSSWAGQGVMLLNSLLSVEQDKPLSHAKIGWQALTDAVIGLLNADQSPKVFVLWGNYAAQKSDLITNSNHLILKAPHPSPLSSYRGFFGSKPFSKANDFLKRSGRQVHWT